MMHRMAVPLRNDPCVDTSSYMLFKLPKRGQTVLNLPARETKCLIDRLLTLPNRCFQGNARIEADFQRLFDICDSDETGVFRSLNLSGVVLDLLLNVVVCSRRAPVCPALLLRIQARHRPLAPTMGAGGSLIYAVTDLDWRIFGQNMALDGVFGQ